MSETKNASKIFRNFVIRPLLIGAALYTLIDLSNKTNIADYIIKRDNNTSRIDSIYEKKSKNVRFLEERVLGNVKDTFYLKDNMRHWDIDIDGDGQKDLWVNISNYDSTGSGVILIRGSMVKNLYQDTVNSATCRAFNHLE